MELTSAQLDRACGVLLGAAVGDALGAGYEFRHDLADVVPAMIGGGLGKFAPGEWTDDTAQAVAIAVVAADGLDLRRPEALDRIAQGFADWYAAGPPDVGIQTSAVLSRAGRNPTGTEMAAAAAEVHVRSGRSAGNGSLMRTGPVALAFLNDPSGLVDAAKAISQLTHYENQAWEPCAGIWVIDAKRYKGRPELQIEGGILRPRVEKMLVGRRDCTELVDGVLKQIDLVRDVVGGFSVTGALCFVEADWPLIGGAFTTRGVHVLWPKRLAKLLTEAEGSADVPVIRDALAAHFKPA